MENILAPLISIYKFIYLQLSDIVGSYGMGLIALSVVTTLLTRPLLSWGAHLQAAEKHIQDIFSPQLEEIRKTSTGAEAHSRIKRLYARYGYHPFMAVRSAAGVMLQVPFLMAAFYMLSSLSDIRGKSFFILRDLSLPDSLFGTLNLLPLLMTLVNIGTAFTTDSFTKKDRLQAGIIALFFLILLYDAPSALLVYWTTNNILGLLGNLLSRAGVRWVNYILAPAVGIFKRIKEAPAAIYAAAALSLTLFFFIPTDIYLKNVNELVFSFIDMVPFMMGSSFLIIFLLCISYWFLCRREGKLKDAFLITVFSLFLGVFLQGYVLQSDYGLLDGREIKWEEYRIEAIKNTLIWVGVFLSSFIAYRKTERVTFLSGIKKISVFMILLQIFSSAYAGGNTKKVIKEAPVLTTDLIYDISSKDNIIVFVLDAFDSSIFEDIAMKEPEVVQRLQGFTYYPDALSLYGFTNYSMPQMLTGVIAKEEEIDSEYIDRAWKNTKMFDLLHEKNYDVAVYTEGRLVSPSAPIDNLATGHSVVSGEVAAKFLKTGMFRSVPHIFKRYFVVYSGDLNKSSAKDENVIPYEEDDVKFYQGFMGELKFHDDRNSFRWYHLFGAHGPWNMRRDIRRIDIPAEEYRKMVGIDRRYEQALGSLRIALSYIEKMKEHGVFENATIMILADHGHHNTIGSRPLTLVKQPGATTGGVSRRQVSYQSLRATLMARFSTDDFGIPFDKSDDGERFFYIINDKPEKYSINGFAGDKNSWRRVETTEVMNPGHEYSLGAVINFARGGNFPQFRISGWDKTETFGSWTLGAEAELEIKFNDTLKEDAFIELEGNPMKKQIIMVYANEKKIAEWHIARRDKVYRAFLPKKLIRSDGTVRLKFTISNPYNPTPEERIRTKGETRPLGIYVKSMTVKKLDAEYELNQKLGATTEDDSLSKYMMHGWDIREVKGSWTLGKTAGTLFQIGGRPSENLTLKVKAAPFGGRQKIGVFVNGKKVSDWNMKSGVSEYQAVIPKEIVTKEGQIHLVFSIGSPNPETNPQKESRKLGMYVTELSINGNPPGILQRLLQKIRR